VTITVETNAAEVAASMGARTVEIKKIIKDTMKTVEKETLSNFRRPAANWHHQPKFESLSEQMGNGFTLIVGTDDPVYNMLDKGTKPHIIAPKRPGYPLAFPWGGQGSYSPKTGANSLDSWAGGQVSGGARFFMHVHHPGTKKRNWSKMISKIANARAIILLQDKIGALMQKAIAKNPFKRPAGY
jgi:hypothetical protein